MLNKIKRSILFSFVFFANGVLQSQVYTAGTSYIRYTDINPDTLISYYAPNSSPVDLQIDLNSDGQLDLKIEGAAGGGLGAGYRYISVQSLNVKTFIKLGRYDSIYNNYLQYWWINKVAKPMLYGDTINNAASVWDNSTLYLSNSDYSSGTFVSINDWASSNDFFIGIKLNTLADSLFGWVRVNCPVSNKCYIKDFSIGSCSHSPAFFTTSSDSSICSGESSTLAASPADSYTWSTGAFTSSIIVSPSTTVSYSVEANLYGCPLTSSITQSVDACIGIHEIESGDYVTVYPIPANQYISIVSDKDFEAEYILITVEGKLIPVSLNNNRIDIRDISPGVYVLQIQTRESVLRKKITID